MFWHASVHPSICLSTGGGGVPISHNALQHFPECHEAAAGGVPGSPPGGYPGQVPPRGGTQTPPGSGTPPQEGGYPDPPPPRGGTWVRCPPLGGLPRPPRGTRVRYLPPGGYLDPPGGVPGSGAPPGGVPRSGTPRGGTQTPPGGYPGQVPPPGGGTRVGQQKEYSLHGGRYASCVHAGGLSCCSNDRRSLLRQHLFVLSTSDIVSLTSDRSRCKDSEYYMTFVFAG